jgi:hypothetical protein
MKKESDMSVNEFVGMTKLDDNFFDDWVVVSEPRQEEKDQEEAFLGTTTMSLNICDDISDDICNNNSYNNDEIFASFVTLRPLSSFTLP